MNTATHKSHKIISLLLALMMIIGMLPMTVFTAFAATQIPSYGTIAHGYGSFNWILDSDTPGEDFYNLVDQKIHSMHPELFRFPGRTYVAPSEIQQGDGEYNYGFLWSDSKNQTFVYGKTYYVYAAAAHYTNDYHLYEYYVTVQKGHRISYSASGAPSGYGGVKVNGGSTSKSGSLTIDSGSNVSFEVVEVPGHTYTVNSGGVGYSKSGNTYTFSNVNKRVNFTVTYTPTSYATVTFTQPEGATITVNGETDGSARVISGINYTVSVKAKSGYQLNEVKFDGATKTISDNQSSFTFTAGANNTTHTVSASAARLNIATKTEADFHLKQGDDAIDFVEGIFEALYISSTPSYQKNQVEYSTSYQKPVELQFLQFNGTWASLTNSYYFPDSVEKTVQGLSMQIRITDGTSTSNPGTVNLFYDDITAAKTLSKSFTGETVSLSMTKGEDFTWKNRLSDATGSTLSVYQYYDSNKNPISAPSAVGSYYVRLALTETYILFSDYTSTMTSYSNYIPFSIEKDVINEVSIPDSVIAVGGATPLTSFPGDGYYASVKWTPNVSAFDYKSTYTATVTFIPDAIYTFDAQTTVSYPDEANYRLVSLTGDQLVAELTFTTTCEQHPYVNGICTECGEYKPAVLNESGVYEISNAGKLMWFAEQINSGAIAKNANAVLTADIDMTGIDWTPICSTGLYYSNSYASSYGTADTGYAGTFDGDGYVIKNLSVTAIAGETWTYGLFGTMTGTVKNLGIEGFTYNHNGASDMRTGAIVGQNLGGTIENCYVVKATITPGTNVAGGITGCNYAGTIRNCYVADSNIVASSARYGYIAGDNRADTAGDRVGTIENCYTDGDRLVGSYTGIETGCGIRSESQFASGEVAYLLGNAWEQGETLPVLRGGATVYENLCGGDVFYSTIDGDFDSHDIGSDYRCTNCGSYVPATLVTAENYSSLGLDESYVGYYAIENASNLYWYSERERMGDISGSIVLLNNITLDNSKAEWVPIVWEGDCTFDGRGNTITMNLNYGTTQRTGNYGLFGTCNYSVVKNLVLDGDLTINTTGHVGAVAGSMYRTTVSGVISTANVTNTCTTSGSVGGLAGCFGGQHDPARNQYSKIENSAVYANVTGYNAGGLVGEGWGGYQYWDITNAAYVGKVTTNNTTSGTAGAIVGYQNTDYNTSTFTNIYWCETNSLGFYGKRDTENQVYTNTSAKTAAQFASGEVAYLLNGGVTDGTQIWYQTLGSDAVPGFTGEVIYTYEDCEGIVRYANTTLSTGTHPYDNGFCISCDAYLPATLTTDKYDVNGDGTKDSVYEISNAGQLYWFAGLVNGTLENVTQDIAANAILMNDITVNQDLLTDKITIADDNTATVNTGKTVREWIPIGAWGDNYSPVLKVIYEGTFDGGDHTVSGLYFNNGAISQIGLIGDTEGIVRNVKTADCYFYGNNNIGGVVGYMEDGALVENCVNLSSVASGLGARVGGIVGTAETAYIGDSIRASIEFCINYADVTAPEHVGGIVGYSNDGWIAYCCNYGDISADNGAAGIVGYTKNYLQIYSCYNNGSVAATDATTAFAIAFTYNKCATIEKCYNNFDVCPIELCAAVGSAYVYNCNQKTTAQFASGEVAYLLNGGVTDGTQPWYQTVGQGYPLFSGETVYYVGSCTAGTSLYSNDNESGAHLYNEEDVCTLCGLARGDVDADGSVTIADVTDLLNYLADTTFVLKGEGDVNLDGSITISDVTALLNILAGN